MMNKIENFRVQTYNKKETCNNYSELNERKRRKKKSNITNSIMKTGMIPGVKTGMIPGVT